ncbi:hypothetical protein K503DRAFT_775896 [Rhizopogon vinicolor AM-OR11-026]|uniref:DUF6533 domain-containing protein n=1 Tax=Rhizopogon vinicolor AM-OR11-026 TaxID=1314800 RepID=A0A1B7MKP8_9AGAM|nr:hypothetical protein K503DRAFT_775896 [Rhizopogon vinicolor AM-OR11-026]
MTFILNNPILWPVIRYFRGFTYFQVVCLTAVVYDLTLTFGQEFELVWRQRWSLMTFLYLSVRYIGIVYTVAIMLPNLPSVSLTDTGCTTLYFVENWMGIIINGLLCVIIITRLYAMYQRSRRMLILLAVTFLAIQITSVVILAIQAAYTSGEEYVLSGAHMCGYSFPDNIVLPEQMTWVLGTVWEIFALCLAVWIAVKHFREAQRPSTGSTVEDCFTVLVKSHVFYFASFVAASGLQLGNLSPVLFNSNSLGTMFFDGIRQLTRTVQMVILGPRLILGLREYHANLVADSDEGTGMASIVFQERVHISTGSGV